MKKVGLLVLALVFAVGALGVGYAMWYDTIYIDGTVNTGSVDIDVYDTSETWAYKVLIAGDYDIDDDINTADVHYDADAILFASYEIGEDPDEDGTNELCYVASAVAASNPTTEKENHIVMTFDQIFPTAVYSGTFGSGTIESGQELVADAEFEYVGTIPAHIYLSDVTWEVLGTYDLGILDDTDPACLDVKWFYKAFGTSTFVESTLASVQLHEGDMLRIEVFFNSGVLQDSGKDAQGLGGKFSFYIDAYQWNETYVEGTSGTSVQ